MDIELVSGTPADLFPEINAVRGVVIIPDIWGRRSLFTDMASRLASTNRWNVSVVEILPNREFEQNTLEERLNAIGQLNDEDVVSDLVDAANRLEVEPVALIGFCIGGMYCYKAAAANRFDRIVSFYGMIKVPASANGPGHRQPLDLLQHVDDASSILSIVGTEDDYTPDAEVVRLEELGVQVKRFHGARHGFAHDPSRETHRPKDAALAWDATVQHLR